MDSMAHQNGLLPRSPLFETIVRYELDAIRP